MNFPMDVQVNFFPAYKQCSNCLSALPTDVTEANTRFTATARTDYNAETVRRKVATDSNSAKVTREQFEDRKPAGDFSFLMVRDAVEEPTIRLFQVTRVDINVDGIAGGRQIRKLRLVNGHSFNTATTVPVLAFSPASASFGAVGACLTINPVSEDAFIVTLATAQFNGQIKLERPRSGRFARFRKKTKILTLDHGRAYPATYGSIIHFN